MFNKLKSKNNENRIKVQFNITIQTVKDLPATVFGNDVLIECKRGSKSDNHKSTRRVQAKEATVTIDEKIPILCTFNQNAKNKKFEPKKELTFLLKEARKDSKEKDPKKVGEEVAKGVIDLATYADTNTVKQENIVLTPKDKKGKKISLAVKIETQWLKVGNKLVVKKGTGNEPEDYVLETAEEFTETNASFSDNEEEKFPDDDEENNNNNKKKLDKSESKSSKDVKKGAENGVDKDQYETEISDLRKDRDRLERKVSRLQDKIDEMEANGPRGPEDANQELEDLRKDKARLEKKVDRLSKEVEQLREELEKGGSGAPSSDNSEVDDLKKDNQRLEKKVEKLTKDLNDARSQIPVSGSDNSEKENLQKQITDLQNQLKAESESKKELQANLDKLTKSQKEAQTKADENDKKVKDLQKQLSEKTSSVESLEKQLKEKSTSASKTPVVTSSKDDASKLKEENADLKKQQEQWNQKESEYKSKISKKKEKTASLKSQVQQLQAQVAASSTSQTQNQSQVDQLKKQNQSLSDEVDQLKSENSKKTQNIQSLEEQLQKLRELNTSSSSSSSKQKAVVEQQQQQIQQQSQTIKDLQDELQKIKKDAKQNESSKTESESKIAQLEAQIEKLQDENEDAKSNLSKSNSKRDQYKKELDKLKDEYDEETERMSAEIAKLKEQNASSSKQPQAVASTSSTGSDEKVKKLKEELAEAQTKNKETETKLKKQLEEKDKEITQLKQLAAANESKKPEAKGSQDSEDSKKLKRIEKELEAYKRKVTALTRQNQELQLLEEVIYSNDNQFDADKAMPLAVQTLAERLNDWGTLVDSEINTQLLDDITNAVKKSFARSAYDSEGLAYWLSFTANAFVLLKKEIPSDSQPEDFDSLSRPTLADNLEDFKPVTKFFHELTVVSFDIFSVLLINIYSQLDHILVPSVLESNDKKKQHTNEFPTILGDILKLLKKNFLHDQIIKHFLVQIFYFIDCQLFNTLLKRPDLFTCNSGFQIKMALSQVENSVSKVDKQLATIVSKQFNHIKEAVNLLLMDKSIVGDEETVNQIFSHLNLLQIKHVLDRFKPDELSPEPVPDKVKRSIEDACKRSGSQLTLELDPMKIERVNLLSEL